MTYYNVTEYFEKFCCDKGLQLEPASLIELHAVPAYPDLGLTTVQYSISKVSMLEK
jgi:hypothetical protein